MGLVRARCGLTHGSGRMNVEARLLLGFDDAQSDSGHGKGWHWWYWSRLLQKKMAQGFAGGQGTATAELLTQGTAGRGRMQSGILANPLPCLYRANMGSRKVISAPFRYSQRIWPFWPSCSTKKNCELNY